MVTEIAKATPEQIREVLNMLVSGATSDASSMQEIAGTWWRRLLFMRWFGPRFLGKQMDTFVATRGADIIGFLIVQYDGDSAGTFDWAFVEPLDNEKNREDFVDLIDTALDYLEDQGLYPYFYFGFATASSPEIAQLLEEIGLRSADYQTNQMVGSLPLDETSGLPDGFTVAPQISARFNARMADLLPAAYPGASTAEVDMIASIHTSTLRSSKVFVILEDGNEIGFVQQFRWREELRLLFALPPQLWGSAAEHQLVAHFAQKMQGQNRQIRLRTFSQGHLEAARNSLSGLGLTWEQAPWQRWVVGLEGNQDEEGESDNKVGPDNKVDKYPSTWPQQPPPVEPEAGSGPSDTLQQDSEQETKKNNHGTN